MITYLEQQRIANAADILNRRGVEQECEPEVFTCEICDENHESVTHCDICGKQVCDTHCIHETILFKDGTENTLAVCVYCHDDFKVKG